MLYKMVQTCDSVLISVDGCEVSVPYQTKEQYFFTMHATRGSVDILLSNYPNELSKYYHCNEIYGVLLFSDNIYWPAQGASLVCG